MTNNVKKNNNKRRALQFGPTPGLTKLPIPSEQRIVENEIYLWRSVIDQAVYDLVNKDDSTKSKRLRKQARNWMQGIVTNKDEQRFNDFEFICGLADIEPSKVRKWISAVEKGLEDDR